MNTRRCFLKQTLTASSLGLFAAGCRSLPPLTAARSVDFEVTELRTITRRPDLYHGWPTLAQRRNGELVLVYSGGREAHVCPFGRVELMTSRDEGRTWSEPRVLIEGPIDDRDAGVVETFRGTLLVTTFTSLAYAPILDRALKEGNWPAERVDRWRAVHEQLSAEEREARLGQWMIRSDDGGRTWSEPYSSIVNSPHGPVQLRDGRLLYAGKELWTGERRNGFCESRDDGRTWRWLAELPVRPGDRAAEYHELHAVETRTGRLIAHIRNHNEPNRNETLQSESDDGGRSWTEPRSIGIWGLPSHLLRLRDGRLLMTYGHRRPPFGNQARLSADDGRSWSEPVIISGDGTGGDLGYPSTVELRNGSLLTIWYEQMAGAARAVLRQARWSPRS
jgi:sialidase-1